jgi:hypothetical protein
MSGSSVELKIVLHVGIVTLESDFLDLAAGLVTPVVTLLVVLLFGIRVTLLTRACDNIKSVSTLLTKLSWHHHMLILLLPFICNDGHGVIAVSACWPRCKAWGKSLCKPM